MLNLKSSFFGERAEEKAQNTALPNSFGQVRTLKSDFENVQSGKKDAEEEVIPSGNVSPQSLSEQYVQNMPPGGPEMSGQENIPSSSVGTSQSNQSFSPPSQAPAASSPFSENNSANPFPGSLGSSSYFEKSPFEGINPADANVSPADNAPVQVKSGGNKTLVVALSAIMAVVIFGGGVYYWFVIRKASTETEVPISQEQQGSTSVVTPSSQEKKESENKNLRTLNVDVSAGSENLKSKISSMVGDFLNSSDLDLIEVNVLDRNNQPIKVKDFLAVFVPDLPESISSHLADTYTIFMKKDNSLVRLGSVFQLSNPEGLSELLSRDESTLPSKFKNLYLDAPPSSVGVTFGSSQYNGANIRYANFPDQANASFDYSVVKGKEYSYLVLSTSKNTTHSILDYMTGK